MRKEKINTTWQKVKFVLKHMLQDKHDYHKILKKRFEQKKLNVKQHFKADMGLNIYGVSGTINKYAKEQMKVHRHFKRWLIEPALHIGQLFLGKVLKKPVPQTQQFKLLNVFDTAFEEALVQWNNYYRVTMGRVDRPAKLRKIAIKLYKAKATKLLRTFKQFYVTGTRNDTAYLMFHDILMLTIWKQMHDKYKDDKRMMHILYNSNKIDDLKYFVTTGHFPEKMTMPLQNGISITIDTKPLIQEAMKQTVELHECQKVYDPLNKKEDKRILDKIKKGEIEVGK